MVLTVRAVQLRHNGNSVYKRASRETRDHVFPLRCQEVHARDYRFLLFPFLLEKRKEKKIISESDFAKLSSYKDSPEQIKAFA